MQIHDDKITNPSSFFVEDLEIYSRGTRQNMTAIFNARMNDARENRFLWSRILWHDTNKPLP